jgi:pSer/pThr/pTyr-binding forkhead associated (FHA) protein
MVQRAFEARTDTLATWDLLQRNCLLLKAEQERSASALSDRIRDVKQTKIDTGELAYKAPEPAKPVARKKSVIRRIRPASKPKQPQPPAEVKKPAQPTPEYLKPVSPSKAAQPVRQLKRLSTSRIVPTAAANLYWLTITSTKRHIALPVNGQLSLGHFDPNVGIPPDIDLTFEDQASQFVSRRHATVVGKNGTHTIEDLGSRAGVFLNGAQVNTGPSRLLEEGDRISLGDVEMIYERVPSSVLIGAQSSRTQHILTVTPTGRTIRIGPFDDIVVGRADPQVNFMPDIDLSVDGEVARLVSRRHAVIRWREGRPHLEDLGSGFGSRLGGELLTLGQAVALKPGDHIWLAGCVLAYDIEL